MWGGFLSFMKKQNLKYTEHFFDIADDGSLGWLKIALACVLLRPIRLINEVGKKLIFIEKNSLLYVLRVSIILNLFLLFSNLLESMFLDQLQRTYMPFSVLCSSVIILCLFYWRIYSLKSYDFKTVKDDEVFSMEETDKVNDNNSFDISQEEIKEDEIFDNVSADSVLFNDSINIFIQEPDELDSLDIHPAAYFDAEESRLLNAIETSNSILDENSIELFDPLNGEDDQIADIMEELQKQLQCS